METHFARAARKIALTPMQRSIIIGSLLGDGTLMRTTAGYCFRVHHGLAQSELVDWRYRVLATHVRTSPRVSGRGMYFRTVTHAAFAELREQFYDSSAKRVPVELLERNLDGLALAVWVMDDGARDGHQLRLNTQCFTFREVGALASILNEKFGIEMRINLDKGRPRLRASAATMQKLLALIAEHTIPSMLYKLRSNST